MLEVIRDEQGRMTAVCEWLTFNQEGKLDEHGLTVFIGELEINPEHRGKGVIRQLAREIRKKAPQASRVFWFRMSKYPKRGHRVYTVEQILRRVG